MGRRQVCRLQAAPLAAATAHLRHYERFWNTRLDALEALVTDPKEEPVTDPVVPHVVTVRRTIAATPDALYRAWTEPLLLERWFGTVVTADVRIGGRYRVEIHESDGTVNGFVGEYLTLDPPQHRRLHLHPHRADPGRPDQRRDRHRHVPRPTTSTRSWCS